MSKLVKSFSNFIIASFLLLGFSQVVVAETNKQRIEVFAGQGKLVELSQAARTVFISDKKVADYQVPASKKLFLLGLRPGKTKMYVLNASEQVVFDADIIVSYDLSELRRLISDQYGDLTVEIEQSMNRVLVKGTVADATTADGILNLAEQFMQSLFEETVGQRAANGNQTVETPNSLVINQLTISQPTQVNIRVRVAEVSRTISNQFGFNWGTPTASGARDIGLGYQFEWSDAKLGSIFHLQKNSLFGSLEALASEGLINILAEPNLTAMSGENASFLAGGEIAIPVPEGNDRVSIDFKQYGVLLDVTPTVLSENRISLRIKPEVSSLNYNNPIELNGTQIPGITVRRAETTIELASGQSFALAGLLQSNENTRINNFPYLADIPVLGSLFKSDRFQREETELVILATVYTVSPTSDRRYRLPQDGLQPYSQVERFLGKGHLIRPSGQQHSQEVPPQIPRLLGDHGFYY